MMRATILVLLALAIAGCTQTTSPTALPFNGSWAGGPTTCSDPFAFTSTTYRAPGGRPMPIQAVEREGEAYVLFFADGYRIAVAALPGGRLSWLSLISGDQFELERC